nr:MAG TPA: MBDR REGULATOR, TETR FAMILY [Caudoviricetes sp.]
MFFGSFCRFRGKIYRHFAQTNDLFLDLLIKFAKNYLRIARYLL